MLEYTVDLMVNLLINLTSWTLSLESISQKKEWPSFISNFCFNFNKNTYFTNYMEKNIFLKLEFKSSFSTKKYWYTIKDKQQFEMRNEIFVMCFVED